MAVVQQVDPGSASIVRFRDLIDGDVWSSLEKEMAGLATATRGHVVWNVNSTAQGGGVAELLAALIPYDRGSGIDERWAVIEGAPEFFSVTKKIHVLLHGVSADGPSLTEAERRTYEEATTRNAAALTTMIRPRDVAILHDPQTVGLVPALSARGAHVIWRAHIGVDQANDTVRAAWNFLEPYMSHAEAYVFSRRAYVWDGLDDSRVHIIPPSIDPFTNKNEELSVDEMRGILNAAGLIQGQSVSRRVTLKATLDGSAPPPDARLVVQVSRWDRLKDPAGVLETFAAHIAPATGAWLVLAGPAASSVNDDPEQPEILRDLRSRRASLPAAIRERAVLAQLPMQDIAENALMVNALQRRADVVIQKSLAEGFGLTVAEAMWKSRPVVASRVGGIEDQIEDGISGVLIDDPKDFAAFGSAVVGLLRDPHRARMLGEAARRRIARQFIAPCHLIEQAQLIQGLLAK